jgi:hypothetical protein
MQRGFLLDVVVVEGALVVQLFARVDESLLVRGDALFVENFFLERLHAVGGFDVDGDGFARERFYEYLHFSERFTYCN